MEKTGKIIADQYALLAELNRDHSAEVLKMKSIYRAEVEIYEDLQNKAIKKEIKLIVLAVRKLFPQFKVKATKFGFQISSKYGISKKGEIAENEKSGLGDYFWGQEIYRKLISELGVIIKTVGEDIAWFDPDNDSEYNSKTSWVYTAIRYDLKKTYINKVYNFKTAPKSNI